MAAVHVHLAHFARAQQRRGGVGGDGADFEQAVIVAVFGHEVDAFLQDFLGGEAGDVLAVQGDGAGKRLVAAEDRADHLGAAGAHHARDPQDLAGIEIEADVAEAVAGEIAYLQDGLVFS